MKDFHDDFDSAEPPGGLGRKNVATNKRSRDRGGFAWRGEVVIGVGPSESSSAVGG